MQSEEYNILQLLILNQSFFLFVNHQTNHIVFLSRDLSCFSWELPGPANYKSVFSVLTNHRSWLEQYLSFSVFWTYFTD